MDDELDIRIRKAKGRGFFAEENGHVVEARSTRAEMAEWLENRLGQVPGEIEQEQRDAADMAEQFPRAFQRVESESNIISIRPRQGIVSRLFRRG